MGATTDKVKGTANEAIGKAKQGIGEAVGSDQLQGEGAIQEVEGQGPAGARRCQASHQGRRQQGGRRGEQEALIPLASNLIGKGRSCGPAFSCLAALAPYPSPLKRAGNSSAFAAAAPYFTPSSSTSNISVAFGGMTPPAPRAP